MSLPVGVDVGPFRLIERIGSGAVATVYRAGHVALEGHVAIKVLNEFISRDPSCRERFQRAARAAALLNHPSVVNVFDFGEEQGITYMAMELIEGNTLADRLTAPMDPSEVVQILEPIARALDHAHAHDVLHLNIKPSNIIFRVDGTPTLAGFGLATIAGGAGEGYDPRTVLGSSEYLSPEQAMGNSVGPASDIYSLAVVCREMLTGLVPFRAGMSTQSLVAVNSPVQVALAAAASLPDCVTEVLAQALAPDPADRCSSAVQFVAGLRPASLP